MVYIRKIEELNVKNKIILCRVDLNVPIFHGRVQDITRIIKLKPTLDYLLKNNAKIVLLSHLGRPKAGFDRDLSLAPVVDIISQIMENRQVKFAVDCIGSEAQKAVDDLKAGEILVLENLRFHAGEEKNDPEFVSKLAELGDFYINDTFSCSHRSHASITGLAQKLPSAAGKLLIEEIESIEKVLSGSDKPMTVITGGSKISTKLALLKNIMKKADNIVIGGAMASSFLKAQNYNIGISLCEDGLLDKAREILDSAKSNNCRIILPTDVVVAKKFAAKESCKIKNIANIANDEMILDLGPLSVENIGNILKASKTVVWNGPLGAFEISPFDVGTICLARYIASLTEQNKIISLAGGGDVVSAIKSAGLSEQFSYISTAGGAFLEWLEGHILPGVKVLMK